MANLYGPMQFTPNPSGVSLNSRPAGFQVPQAIAPTAQQATPNYGMSYNEWMKSTGRDRINFGSRYMDNIDHGSQMAYNKYLRDGGMVAPAGGGPGSLASIFGGKDFRGNFGGNVGGGAGLFGGGGGSGAASRPQGILSAGGRSLDPVAAAYTQYLNGGA